MTGGRLKRVARYLEDDDTFLLTYGTASATSTSAACSNFIASTDALRPSPPSHHLSLRSARSRCPGPGAALHGKTEGEWLDQRGFFVFNRRVLDYLGGPECMLEREPLERLAREGELMAYRHDGFFYAMDTYREYNT